MQPPRAPTRPRPQRHRLRAQRQRPAVHRVCVRLRSLMQPHLVPCRALAFWRPCHSVWLYPRHQRARPTSTTQGPRYLLLAINVVTTADTLCSAEVKPLPTGGLAVLFRGRRARRSGRRGVQGSTPAWPRRSPQQGSAKAGCRRASMLVLRRHMVLLSHAACQTVIACCLTSSFAAKAGKAVLTLLAHRGRLK